MPNPIKPAEGLDWTPHNPSLLSRQTLIDRFLIRGELLEELVRELRAQPAGAGLRHLLCIGQRGMGKTTLLRRLCYLVEDDAALRARFVPILFAEEQYNISDLADLFLEVLRRAAGVPLSAAAGLLAEVEKLLDEPLPARQLADAIYEQLMQLCRREGRQLIVFIDNINDILGGLPEPDSLRLRQLLMTDPYLLIIGAAPTYFAAITEYEKPFFEFFRVFRLDPLTQEELFWYLRSIASHNKSTEIIQAIDQNSGRIKTFYQLTGGNPRIALFLYRLMAESPHGEIRRDLERLIDEVTPYYKHRLESLSPQQRRVFDAVARRFNPVEVHELTRDLRQKSNAVSVQLSRLINSGFIEEIGSHKKQKLYQVAERLFNIYYLMRLSRTGRQQLQWLVQFLQALYEPVAIRELAQTWIRHWSVRVATAGERAESWTQYGQSVLKRNALAEAREALQKAVESGPQDRAWAQLGLGQLDESGATIAAALPLAPRDSGLLLAQTYVYLARDQIPDALLAFSASIHGLDVQVLEQNQQAFLQAGLTLSQRGCASAVAALIDAATHLALPARWQPLRAALSILLDDKQATLDRMAPEVRAAVENVLARLKSPEL